MIPVNTPLLDGNELKYLTECIETGWISSEGMFVEQFEAAMCALTGRQHAIAVANGSLALDLVLQLSGLGPGDEVILPTFTIISCAAAIVRCGAIPVLVDSDADTWNMDVEQVASKIGPRTKAILIPHTYGLPVDADTILSLAQKHALLVIEDAAEAHGQTYKGRQCGSIGHVSIFSFYANKHVTAGEGGMVLTDDPALARSAKSRRNLCFIPHRRFWHEELGWNYRLSNLQAAVGLAQLEQLPRFTDLKRRMGRLYTQAFATMSTLQLPMQGTSYAENNYWVYGLVTRRESSYDSEEASRALKNMGVATRPFFWPMHEQPVFRRLGMFERETYPVAEMLARRGFYLPSGLGLSDPDLVRVIEAVQEVFA